MLIKEYDLEVETSPCKPGSDEFAATVRLNVDISLVLPYLNRTLCGVRYNANTPSLAWKRSRQCIAFWSYKIAANHLRTRTQAQAVARGLIDLVNRTWVRRTEIDPDYEAHRHPGPMAIYKLLPQTSCRVCGQPTCFTFALRVVARRARLDDCRPLQEPEYARQRMELAELLA